MANSIFFRFIVIALVALGCVNARSAQAAEPFFMKQTGGFYHYVRESSTTFSSIQSNIESGYYSSRGVRNLVFYCPYRASEEYRGVPAIDYFDTNPNTGSVEDFQAMAVAAHAQGMAVVAYMGVLFVDPENAIWVQAQEDHKDGTSSPEANTFLWADDDSGEVQDYGGWEYSDVADSYYATSWGRPAINLGQADGRAYVKSVLEFWMDLGVDGFEYDSIESFWGQTGGILTDVLVTYPNSFLMDPAYLIREGPLASYYNSEESDAIGLTHVLLSGDTDDSSVATDVVNGGMTVDALETHFATYLDARRALVRGAKAVSNYSDMSATERAFEAAVLAGNGASMEIDYDAIYKNLDQEQQSQYDTVFVALARSSAEAPGASRERLPTGTNPLAYAVVRVSADGAARALNVYNFGKQASTVSVDLTGTEIAVDDVPIDLVTNEPAAAVTSTDYSVSLPALGYAFLGFGELNGAGGSGGAGGSAGAGGSGGAGGNGGLGGSSAGPQGGTQSAGGAVVGSGGAMPNGGGATSSPVSTNDDTGCSCSSVPRSGGEPLLIAMGILFAASLKRRSRSPSASNALYFV